MHGKGTSFSGKFSLLLQKSSIFAIAVMAVAGRNVLAGREKLNHANIQYETIEVFDGTGLVGRRCLSMPGTELSS
jgi:hypothetical protein